MAKPSCQKPFREKDAELLMRISQGAPGHLWRSPLIEAVKRAGAQVYTDKQHKLHIVFGTHVLHPSRLDLGRCEDFAGDFGGGLRDMARDLLAHRGRTPA